MKTNDSQIFKEITAELYAALSGPKGKRDWEAMRSLFHPEARLARTGLTEKNETWFQVMSFDRYQEIANEILNRTDFLEEEVNQKIKIFGNVAQVTSVYRSVYGKGKGAFQNRGVNFLNLVFDGKKWSILSIVWDNEREGLSIPKEFLTP